MRIVEPPSLVSYRQPQQPKKRPNRVAWSAVLVVAIFGIVGAAFHFSTSHADTSTNTHAIRSGLSSACLDVFHNEVKTDAPVDIATCNGTTAQSWTATETAIRQVDANQCISATPSGSIIMQPCTDTPSQVWLRDQLGYYNPDTGKCLSASANGVQLRLENCDQLGSAGEMWSLSSSVQAGCNGGKGLLVACETVRQWTAWQASGSNHEALLTAYTDGTPDEEWCADFVSYIYKQAGYPFTGGSADGWDQNDSNSVQYMGFTKHTATSGYIPKAGDVAFFNYPGGHVEIVISGGTRPTFVYGDSAETDPTTGNGQMKANTITQDGEEGSVVYYLSPNS